MQRTYGQFCALAHALDIVGERWTLLVVRELASGPKRYTDLLAALPGIGTSLLASRLKSLREREVVTGRRLPAPAASLVYELTDAGRELADALLPLVLWGARHAMTTRDEAEVFRAEWPLLVLRAIASPEAGRTDVYEFRIDDSVAHVRAVDGEFEVHTGPAQRPDVVLSTDAATFVALGAGRVEIDDVVADGRLLVEGDSTVAARLAAAMRPATAC
jgi:DNA-binding HxlR family transcriptional regulator/putative sterol carrier protein